MEGQGKAVEGQGKAVEGQGKAVESQGKAVEGQGKAVSYSIRTFLEVCSPIVHSAFCCMSSLSSAVTPGFQRYSTCEGDWAGGRGWKAVEDSPTRVFGVCVCVGWCGSGGGEVLRVIQRCVGCVGCAGAEELERARRRNGVAAQVGRAAMAADAAQAGGVVHCRRSGGE